MNIDFLLLPDNEISNGFQFIIKNTVSKCLEVLGKPIELKLILCVSVSESSPLRFFYCQDNENGDAEDLFLFSVRVISKMPDFDVSICIEFSNQMVSAFVNYKYE